MSGVKYVQMYTLQTIPLKKSRQLLRKYIYDPHIKLIYRQHMISLFFCMALYK